MERSICMRVRWELKLCGACRCVHCTMWRCVRGKCITVDCGWQWLFTVWNVEGSISQASVECRSVGGRLTIFFIYLYMATALDEKVTLWFIVLKRSQISNVFFFPKFQIYSFPFRFRGLHFIFSNQIKLSAQPTSDAAWSWSQHHTNP